MEFVKTTLLSKNDNHVYIAKNGNETYLAEEIAANIYIIYSEYVSYAYDAEHNKTIAPQYLLNTIFSRGE